MLSKYFKAEQLLFSFFLMILFFFNTGDARQNGITGRTKKFNAGCNDCHGANATMSVTVMIMGPDTIEVNQTANYSVMLMGGPAVKGGTNIAVSNGTLIGTSASLKKVSDELTHVSPTSFSGGMLEFQFTYKATATGTQTLYATGNSVNGNGQSSGDQWNWAPNKTVTIISPALTEDNISVAKTYALLQNYPNPFNPTTTIRFTILESQFAMLKIYNIFGGEVATLVNEISDVGAHTISFDGSSFGGGIYFYELRTKNFSERKKMILLK